MALKATLETLDGLSEEIQGMYRKEGDVYVLDLSTDDLKAHPSNKGLINALEHERDNSKTTKTELTELREKLGDLDLEKAREALAKIEEAEDKELIDAGEIEAIVEKRLTAVKRDHEKQLEALNTANAELKAGNETLTTEIADIKIFDAVKSAAAKAGAKPEALTDIQNRARGIWQLKDGRPTAFDGEDTMFGKDGQALTIDEWVGQLAESADYLFQPNRGAGSSGSDTRTNTDGIKLINPGAAGDNIAAIAGGEAIIQR